MDTVIGSTADTALPLAALISNAFVLAISVKVVRHNYKYFLVNLALVDMGFAVFFSLTNMYWRFSAVGLSATLCSVNAAVSVTLVCHMLHSLPLLPLSRFVRLYYPLAYAKYMKKRGCLLILTLVFVVTCVNTYLSVHAGVLGHVRHVP